MTTTSAERGSAEVLTLRGMEKSLRKWGGATNFVKSPFLNPISEFRDAEEVRVWPFGGGLLRNEDGTTKESIDRRNRNDTWKSMVRRSRKLQQIEEDVLSDGYGTHVSYHHPFEIVWNPSLTIGKINVVLEL